jgi:hypothetical protein
VTTSFPSPPADGSVEAIFHTLDSQIVEQIATIGVGMAAIGGMSSVTGTAANSMLRTVFPARRNKPLLHRLLVRTDETGVKLYASNRNGRQGPLVLDVRSGTFQARLHRNIGQIELTLFINDRDPITLVGKWGPFRRQPMRVAKVIIRSCSLP